ncbi:MAG: hypothetical protein IH830_14495 [Planctomycetes bacterium]|nr:hypothetical protein [Planctomycetota bacterium]
MDLDIYSYAIGISSQFYYCALPLRIDTYSQCLYDCAYCFARARGGFRSRKAIALMDVPRFSRQLEQSLTEQPKSILGEFLHRRLPIHLGGMTDPFPPIELKHRITLDLLKLLARWQYPTIVSTKSDIVAREAYLDVLTQGRFVVQLSMSSTDDGLLRVIDRGTAGPTRLLQAARTLLGAGIHVSCRIQPLLPSRESDAFQLIDECSNVGLRHVAVEHLKLPLETTWRGTDVLSKCLKTDVRQYYKQRHALRVGREWVLPTDERLDRVLELRDYTHTHGMSFAAADNDLLLFSDGRCCCSGLDVMDADARFFEHTYAEAVRRGLDANRICLGNIDNAWVPKRSIARYVNSRSRIPGRAGKGASIADYIQLNWNGRSNGCSPEMFYGVVKSDERDEHGHCVYHFRDDVRRLLTQS